MSQGTLRTASVHAKTVAAISRLILIDAEAGDESAETVDVDDDLEDEKEKECRLT